RVVIVYARNARAQSCRIPSRREIVHSSWSAWSSRSRLAWSRTYDGQAGKGEDQRCEETSHSRCSIHLSSSSKGYRWGGLRIISQKNFKRVCCARAHLRVVNTEKQRIATKRHRRLKKDFGISVLLCGYS